MDRTPPVQPARYIKVGNAVMTNALFAGLATRAHVGSNSLRGHAWRHDLKGLVVGGIKGLQEGVNGIGIRVWPQQRQARRFCRRPSTRFWCAYRAFRHGDQFLSFIGG